MIKSLKQLGRKSVLPLSLLVVLLIATGSISTPAHAYMTYTQIISRNSLSNQPKCLTVESSYDDGATVGQSDCINDPTQNWFLRRLDDGYVQIVSAFNAKCLDVYNYSHDNGATVETWYCHNGADNQEWDYGEGLGGLELKPRHSEFDNGIGKCLDVLAYNHDNAPNNVIQWDCLGGVNQQWDFDLP